MTIRLVDAGSVPYLRSQTVYHGAAWAQRDGSPNTIILVSPDEPYVCIGLHQELEKEVDVSFCSAHNIPVVRREVGGGAVYLDSDQLFVQWVFQPDSLPRRVEHRFELFAKPLVGTYRELGIPAYFRPVNDIQVNGKKIGGTGAAAIGRAEVLVGSFLFDFNFELMANVLKVPDEKFRDKIHDSLQQYMTTMERELGAQPSRALVKDLYIQQCERTLGEEVIEGQFTEPELEAMAQYDAKFVTEEWLHQKGGLQRGGVKIHNDVWVYDTELKAQGGLIRTTLRLRDNRIDDLSISGDFTFRPAEKLSELERVLVGQEVEGAKLRKTVADFYRAAGVESPGIEPETWVEAIMSVRTKMKPSG
ncbi:MAG: lipoate--protein ligase family protein [Calditrichaeota bacterium]|nr:MAG: lipoate--protein ligase family protein [Calditrichota bacterium]